MRYFGCLTVLLAAGFAAGWRDRFHLVAGSIALLVLFGMTELAIRRLRMGTDSGDDDDPLPSTGGRLARGLVMGAAFFVILVGYFALLQRTPVYDWLADRRGEHLVKQTRDLVRAQAWQGVAGLLGRGLPAGISRFHRTELGRYHVQSVLRIAAATRDIRRRCGWLAEAVRLGAEYDAGDPGAQAGAGICAALLRGRAVPPGSRITLLDWSYTKGGKSVLRLRATDASGASLAALGPSDFLISSEGQLIEVDDVEYAPGPLPPRHFAMVAALSNRARSGLAAVREFIDAAASVADEQDSFEVRMSDCDAPGQVSSLSARTVGRGARALRPADRVCMVQATLASIDAFPRDRGGAVIVFAGSADDGGIGLEAARQRFRETTRLYLIALVETRAAEASLRQIAARAGARFLSLRQDGRGAIARELRAVVSGAPEYRIATAQALRAEPVAVFAPPGRGENGQ